MRLYRELTNLTPRENLTAATTLILLLIFGDLVFIFLHLVDLETGWMRGVRMSLEADGGIPERYQYAKEFWMAGWMAVTFWRTRVRLYAAWSAVFGFLLLDDAAQVHERAGGWLARTFELPAMFGLRSKDMGELMVAAGIGVLIVVMVALTSWRRGEPSQRISRDVFSLICLLGLVGVVVDMLHVVTYLKGSRLANLLLLVEDGGEMLVMSALTAYAFHVTSHDGLTHFDLWATVRAYVVPAGFTRPQVTQVG